MRGGVFLWLDFSLLRFFSYKPALMRGKSGPVLMRSGQEKRNEEVKRFFGEEN
tara:strand:+ start:4609 stop:4767 length:159 start_codon:yes stop_codon:yes gene_type:complete